MGESMVDDNQRLMTVAEAAEYFGISRQAIYKRVGKGQLESVTIGNILYVNITTEMQAEKLEKVKQEFFDEVDNYVKGDRVDKQPNNKPSTSDNVNLKKLNDRIVLLENDNKHLAFEVDLLRSQVSELNKIIADLNDRLREAQSQVTQAMDFADHQQKLTALHVQERLQVSEDKEPEKEPEGQPQPQNTDKPSFWSRLFH